MAPSQEVSESTQGLYYDCGESAKRGLRGRPRYLSHTKPVCIFPLTCSIITLRPGRRQPVFRGGREELYGTSAVVFGKPDPQAGPSSWLARRHLHATARRKPARVLAESGDADQGLMPTILPTPLVEACFEQENQGLFSGDSNEITAAEQVRSKRKCRFCICLYAPSAGPRTA